MGRDTVAAFNESRRATAKAGESIPPDGRTHERLAPGSVRQYDGSAYCLADAVLGVGVMTIGAAVPGALLLILAWCSVSAPATGSRSPGVVAWVLARRTTCSARLCRSGYKESQQRWAEFGPLGR